MMWMVGPGREVAEDQDGEGARHPTCHTHGPLE